MKSDLDLAGTNLKPFEEESGSAYEESSEDEQSQGSPPHGQLALRPAASVTSRRRNQGRSRLDIQSSEPRRRSSPGSTESEAQEIDRDLLEIKASAVKWAATFVPPDQVDSPSRGNRNRTKRKNEAPDIIRAKRFKSFYSGEYRELLNHEIGDALQSSVSADDLSLEESQIGSSIWSAREKDVFFYALAKQGRDDLPGISQRIGTKSEPEVQEYIHLLHEASAERLTEGHRYQALDILDHPAAFEISEECCGILERAGDALTSRQEIWDIEREKAKWDESSWVIDAPVAKWIEKQRRNGEEEAELESSFPAANLFNLKQWLQLSEQIFMNPAAPFEDANWLELAEMGETPAIRATAIEDFYSLAVSITKRLISTTLFCTMSRQKSKHSRLLKSSSVTPFDVEAAVNILGLKQSAQNFWIGCARRCNLEVIDDDLVTSEETVLGHHMSYEEVETALKSKDTSSRSDVPAHDASTQDHLNRAATPSSLRLDSEDLTDSASETSHLSVFNYATENDQITEEEYSSSNNGSIRSDYSFSSSETNQRPITTRALQSQQKRREEIKAKEKAYGAYVESFDVEASRLEEVRLWDLIGQTPPFDLKNKPEEMANPPKKVLSKDDGGDWKKNTKFWSHWEMLAIPVPEDNFLRNKQWMMARKEMKRKLVERYEIEVLQHREDGEEGEDEEEGEGISDDDQVPFQDKVLATQEIYIMREAEENQDEDEYEEGRELDMYEDEGPAQRMSESP